MLWALFLISPVFSFMYPEFDRVEQKSNADCMMHYLNVSQQLVSQMKNLRPDLEPHLKAVENLVGARAPLNLTPPQLTSPKCQSDAPKPRTEKAWETSNDLLNLKDFLAREKGRTMFRLLLIQQKISELFDPKTKMNSRKNQNETRKS